MRNPFDDLVAPARWPELGLRQCLLVAALAVGLFTVASLAWSQGRERAVVDCAQFESIVALAAWARDMKADENMVGIFYRTHHRHLGERMARAIEREVRRLWHEKLPAATAARAAHKRCEETLGDLDTDS